VYLSLECTYPCRASFRSTGTALSGFPHSKQSRLARGVINPQDGHILCERTSCTGGRKTFRNAPKESHAEPRRRRREGRNGSIDSTFAGSPLVELISDKVTMTGHSRRFCAGLLTFLQGHRRGFVKRRWRCSHDHHGSEQLRPAIACRLSDHDHRDEHFFSLFQVP
jgi:hypothetical protein